MPTEKFRQALSYESASSYTIVLAATDGVNTVSKSLSINVGDVAELSYSGTLAASSQTESINTGTLILSSSTSGSQGSLTFLSQILIINLQLTLQPEKSHSTMHWISRRKRRTHSLYR